jgi:hypothetical protein
MPNKRINADGYNIGGLTVKVSGPLVMRNVHGDCGAGQHRGWAVENMGYPYYERLAFEYLTLY